MYRDESRRTTGRGTAGSSRTITRSRRSTGGAIVVQSERARRSVVAGMKLTRPFLVAAALAVALAGAAFAGVVAHKGAAKLTVTVTETEFHIALSPKKGTVGPCPVRRPQPGKLRARARDRRHRGSRRSAQS